MVLLVTNSWMYSVYGEKVSRLTLQTYMYIEMYSEV